MFAQGHFATLRELTGRVGSTPETGQFAPVRQEHFRKQSFLATAQVGQEVPAMEILVSVNGMDSLSIGR